jgi:hypothetical protein
MHLNPKECYVMSHDNNRQKIFSIIDQYFDFITSVLYLELLSLAPRRSLLITDIATFYRLAYYQLIKLYGGEFKCEYIRLWSNIMNRFQTGS